MSWPNKLACLSLVGLTCKAQYRPGRDKHSTLFGPFIKLQLIMFYIIGPWSANFFIDCCFKKLAMLVSEIKKIYIPFGGFEVFPFKLRFEA